MVVDQIAAGVDTAKGLWDIFAKNDQIDENSFINHGGVKISHSLMKEGKPHILLYTDHTHFLDENEVVCRMYDTINNPRGNTVVETDDSIDKFKDYEIIYEMHSGLPSYDVTGRVSMKQINSLITGIYQMGEQLKDMNFFEKILIGSFYVDAIIKSKETPWYNVYVQLKEAIKDGDCGLTEYFPPNSIFIDEYGGGNQDIIKDPGNKIPHIRLDKHIAYFDHEDIIGFENDDRLTDHQQYKDLHVTNFCEIVDYKSRYAKGKNPIPKIDVDNFLYNAENLKMAIEKGMVIDKNTNEEVPFLADGLDNITVIYNIHEHAPGTKSFDNLADAMVAVIEKSFSGAENMQYGSPEVGTQEEYREFIAEKIRTDQEYREYAIRSTKTDIDDLYQSRTHGGVEWYKDLDPEIRKEFIESFFEDLCHYGPNDDLEYIVEIDPTLL